MQGFVDVGMQLVMKCSQKGYTSMPNGILFIKEKEGFNSSVLYAQIDEPIGIDAMFIKKVC